MPGIAISSKCKSVVLSDKNARCCELARRNASSNAAEGSLCRVVEFSWDDSNARATLDAAQGKNFAQSRGAH
jgi:hypothetical protein